MWKKEALIKYLKKFIAGIMSSMVAALFCINMSKEIAISQSLNGNSVALVAVFIIIYWMLKKIGENKNKRLKIFTFVLSLVLAILEVIGKSIDLYGDLSGIINSWSTVLKSVVIFIGYLTIFFIVLANIFLKNPYYKQKLAFCIFL